MVRHRSALSTSECYLFRCLPAVGDENPALIDPNDIRIMLSGLMKLLLSSLEEDVHFCHEFQTPIVRDDYCAWVKYRFVSDINISTDCCSQVKEVNVHVLIKYFMFPSEFDFRSLLKRENI